MSVSVKTSHLAPARFSKISFGLTETHPRCDDGAASASLAIVADADDRDYVMFDPLEDSQRAALLTADQAKFVDKNFSKYMTNEAEGALRGGGGTARGFMARIRGRGATAAARGGRGTTHSRGYTYSRPGGDKARWVQAFFTSRCKVGVGEREPGSRRAGLPRMATREFGTGGGGGGGGPIRLGCVSPRRIK